MDTIRKLIRWSLWPAALAGMIVIAHQPASGQDDGDGVATEAGLQELTRGPIHEAFAEPVVFDPKPGPVVKKEPPQPIEEIPPEQKPEGDNVAFIAGYWGFDEDKDDFFYISGIYRLIPPGKEWVGGYWTKVDEGHQWVSGYWKSVAEAGTPQGEVQYFPEPPPSLENGPNTQAPTADHVWIPGCHVYYTNRYVWRGGYWIVPQPNWVWIPAHYVWTPCGYVFVEGYWDYVNRGVCFAPCYIAPSLYLRAGFVYCPRIVIDFDLCTDHLFVHTGYRHYCFGDWYGDRYLSIGIQPWFSFHYSRGHYCPIYSHARWTYARHDTRWEVELRERHRLVRDNVALRPARTFVQQQTNIKNITINKNVNVTNVNVNKMALAKPLTQVAKQSQDPKAASPIKFEKVNKDTRQTLAQKANEARKVSTERLNLETKAAKDLKTAAGPKTPGNTGVVGPKADAKPLTLKLPASSVASKPVEKLGKKDAPPALPTGAAKPQLPGGDKPVVGGGTNKPGQAGDKTPPIINKPGGDKPVVGGDKNKPGQGGDKTPPIINKPGGDKPVIGGDKNKPGQGGDKTPPIINKPGGDKPVIGGDKNKPGQGGDKTPPIINKPGGDKPVIGGDKSKPGQGGSQKPPIINKPGGSSGSGPKKPNSDNPKKPVSSSNDFRLPPSGISGSANKPSGGVSGNIGSSRGAGRVSTPPPGGLPRGSDTLPVRANDRFTPPGGGSGSIRSASVGGRSSNPPPGGGSSKNSSDKGDGKSRDRNRIR
jgi:hypothetical protein